jgi:hypothetical protein
MLVKISKSEKEAVEYACALADLKVSFYSIENSPEIVQAEMLDLYGEEPGPAISFYLARQIEAKLACEQFSKK